MLLYKRAYKLRVLVVDACQKLSGTRLSRSFNAVIEIDVFINDSTPHLEPIENRAGPLVRIAERQYICSVGIVGVQLVQMKVLRQKMAIH